MRAKAQSILQEATSDQLLEILLNLCEKYPYLNEDIEFLLHPRQVKLSQSYYNKLVKKAIDTNSWSKFPNKGVKGLLQMCEKIKFLEQVRNYPEAEKLALAVLGVTERCRKKYNSQNQEELQYIEKSLSKYQKDSRC